MSVEVKYSWGLKSLDTLTGGIRPTLHMIFGETATGKTTLAAYVPIVRIALETKQKTGSIPGKFIVVDGDGGFDWERLQQIAENNGLKFDELAGNIMYWEVTEFDEQHELLAKTIPKIISEGKMKLLLITVDPLTAIYRGIILRTPLEHRLSTISIYTGKLDLQLATLRHLGVKHGIPVFVTTWSTSRAGDAMRATLAAKLAKEYGVSIEEAMKLVPGMETEFIGGRQMGFLPKLILKLSTVKHGSPERVITLWKARGSPSGVSIKIKLSDRGIEE